MAAFSSLALLGLGLAGGIAASRALGGRQGQQPAAQGSTQASATPAPPPSATETTSTATAQARQAGQRQRRRAAPVSRTQPVRQNPPALLEPLSLLGRL